MAEPQEGVQIFPVDTYNYTVPSGHNIVEHLKTITRDRGLPELGLISCSGRVQKVELKKPNGNVEVHTDEEGSLGILSCCGTISCLNGNMEMSVWLHALKSQQEIGGRVGDEMIARGNVELLVGVNKTD